jgi:hypothetical protein
MARKHSKRILVPVLHHLPCSCETNHLMRCILHLILIMNAHAATLSLSPATFAYSYIPLPTLLTRYGCHDTMQQPLRMRVVVTVS